MEAALAEMAALQPEPELEADDDKDFVGPAGLLFRAFDCAVIHASDKSDFQRKRKSLILISKVQTKKTNRMKQKKRKRRSLRRKSMPGRYVFKVIMCYQLLHRNLQGSAPTCR